MIGFCPMFLQRKPLNRISGNDKNYQQKDRRYKEPAYNCGYDRYGKTDNYHRDNRYDNQGYCHNDFQGYDPGKQPAYTAKQYYAENEPYNGSCPTDTGPGSVPAIVLTALYVWFYFHIKRLSL